MSELAKATESCERLSPTPKYQCLENVERLLLLLLMAVMMMLYCCFFPFEFSPVFGEVAAIRLASFFFFFFFFFRPCG